MMSWCKIAQDAKKLKQIKAVDFIGVNIFKRIL
jgi:hypothetical protein